MEENKRQDKASLTAEKKRIRREMLAVRNALSPAEQRRASCLITERLLGHQWLYRADVLLCYVSCGSELDTRELIREVLRLGKQVYVPRVLEEHRMDFYRIQKPEELEPGFHGIPEPPVTAPVYPGMAGCIGNGEEAPARCAGGVPGRNRKQVLMLMPGVAFDAYGNRLGYGGGYYDRYLAVHPEFQTYSIGIGHSCQRVARLPVEETDCRPYQVILV